MKYSVVIPCYRCADWLTELVERVETTMSALEEPFELILVNDASPDETWQCISELSRKFAFVRGFDLFRNTGQNRATLCGLEQARGEIVIIMDDDLQHPPEEIPVLIRAMHQQPELDCIMGKYEVKHHSLFRNLGSRFAAALFTHLYDKPRHITPSSFRILRRGLVDAMCAHRTVNPAIGPLIYHSTRRIGNISVKHMPRSAGRSGYSLDKLVRIVLYSYFSTSTVPLRLVSVLGFFSVVVSIMLGAYYLFRFFINTENVPGFATQVLLIIFFGGLTLFAVGLVGEYMIRIMDEVRQPPRYVIRETTGEDASA